LATHIGKGRRTTVQHIKYGCDDLLGWKPWSVNLLASTSSCRNLLRFRVAQSVTSKMASRLREARLIEQSHDAIAFPCPFIDSARFEPLGKQSNLSYLTIQSVSTGGH
jgi:hypothetical protein